MSNTPANIRILKKLKEAAKSYKDLMNIQYLIIYENKYIEVIFSKKYFKHLTGIKSSLHSRSFFDDAYRGKIRSYHIGFDAKHPYQLCNKKLNSIINLKDRFHSDLLMLHSVSTPTYIIPKGVTDFDFVLGLDVNNDIKDKKIDNNLVPYTLRVDDEESFSKSKEQFQVDFILSKLKTDSKYSNLCFGQIEYINYLPDNIKALIDFEALFK